MTHAAGATNRVRALRLVALQCVTALAVLAAVTVGMYLVRASLEKAHVALIYLLVVLGASAVGGRVLGLATAGLAFFCFDFFFLGPTLTLAVENPLDWLVLVTFLVTSAVAAQLLHRARRTAEEATQRAIEVDRLAALGAETLNAADAGEALQAIADVIRNSVDADECEIFLSGIDSAVVRVAHTTRPTAERAQSGRADAPFRDTAAGSLAEWILERGTSAVELMDGTIRVAHDAAGPLAADQTRWDGQQETLAAVRAVTQIDRSGDRARLPFGIDRDGLGFEPAVRSLALPLRVRDRTVGVLRVANAEQLMLTTEQARLLIALAYYAALGAERARLVATAERAEAERRMESLRSALLTAVSHDLRTPLTTIKGMASEIRRGTSDERATIIEAEADRMNGLVNDLLDLSRIHAGAVRPAISVNTLDDLIGVALRSASGTLRDRQVNVELPKDSLLVGRFDLTQTLRILVNLLDNAAKYSPAGSPIDVRARRDGERLIIDVMDRGPGVPEQERDRIFDPFYRPSGVPPDVRGHGLGLSIARGLAEAQGGSVRYSGRAQGGAVFTLELPAADAGSLAADLPKNTRGV